MRPQPNTTVKLKNAEGTIEITSVDTDDDGKFSFKDLPPGTYKLSGKFGDRVGEKEVTVEVGKTTKLTLKLRTK